MAGAFSRVMVVTSGGASAAIELTPLPNRTPASPPTPAAPAAPSRLRKRRRPCSIGIPPSTRQIGTSPHRFDESPISAPFLTRKGKLKGRGSDFQHISAHYAERRTVGHSRQIRMPRTSTHRRCQRRSSNGGDHSTRTAAQDRRQKVAWQIDRVLDGRWLLLLRSDCRHQRDAEHPHSGRDIGFLGRRCARKGCSDLRPCRAGDHRETAARSRQLIDRPEPCQESQTMAIVHKRPSRPTVIRGMPDCR